MIALLDTSEDLSICESELGCKCEQLLTPLTRFKPQRPDQEFAIDNGAFANFDPNQFRSLLARECSRKQLCRFVTVPDVVGSAIRTLEAFEYWVNRLHGWKLAYVAQDGQESIGIPWNDIEAIFIGGSDDFKLSPYAAQIVKCAKIMEKWIHIGRVNEPKRFSNWKRFEVNSFDGTGISMFSHMREKIKNADCQGDLLRQIESNDYQENLSKLKIREAGLLK